MREMYCPYCNVTAMHLSSETHCEVCGTLLVAPVLACGSVYEEYMDDSEHYYYEGF